MAQARAQARAQIIHGLQAAAGEVMTACESYYVTRTTFGYFAEGQKKGVPSELGLTDIFMSSLALALGNLQNPQNRTLTDMHYCGDEANLGYDFMLEFTEHDIVHRCYLQAKCVQSTGGINPARYAKFLSRASNGQGERQWKLIRNYVTTEFTVGDYNIEKCKIMGGYASLSHHTRTAYILFSREAVWFVPIGFFIKMSESADAAKSGLFNDVTNPGEDAGLTTIFNEFANDATLRYDSPEVLLTDDWSMLEYAQRTL
ncbi:hypothetical protein BXZ70DRAFT_1017831 [Cristinia sonorae]|uniref:Uncharacterized protein n=1 Tax=Cristinia sonorae TaxID=1940300 RepID=A0A8K0UQQ0_9AGAR|nr:hypothetical protein BXZ70DRAFT_1017831 [Cristinia sonorae]